MRNVAMKCAALLVLVLCAIASPAQTTTVSATIVDPSSTPWGGASYTATVISKGQPPVTIPGYVPFTTKYSGTANSNGVFSVTVQSVAHIFPAGATWQFCVVSGVTFTQSFCVDVPVGNTGQSTQDISAQINAILVTPSITGGPSIRAYNDAEVTAYLGAQYFNVNTLSFRCYSGTWTTCGGGGGGGGSPAAPQNSIQLANAGLNGFISDSLFTINPSTHTLISGGNEQINAMESIPRTLYDPMNTQRDGGLAAAIAGTSGFTPTQVIQATLDYGECQAQMGLAPAYMRIALPNTVIPISQLLVWPTQELSGDSLREQPHLQHTVATASMIKGHGSSDTLTCSNGTTYTPGAANGVIVQNVGIGGTGAVSGSLDIGIEMNGSGWFVYNISGFSNAFGSQAILDDGFENFIYRVGYPGSQLAGCASYVAGLVTGTCGAVQQGSTDGEIDYVYATDGAGIISGHPAGPCYPNCSAILIGGSNVEASHLFAQLSDIDIVVNGANIRGTLWRTDATNREMIRFNTNGGGAVVSNIEGEAPCLDATLAPAYAAGTATNCFGLVDNGQVNQIYGMEMGGQAFFGPSYMEAQIYDGISGGSVTPNTYAMIAFASNGTNTTANDLLIACVCDGQPGTPRLVLPIMAPVQIGNTGTVNVEGINAIGLSSTTPLTTLNDGLPGQQVIVYAGLNGFSPQTGATIGPGGNIQLCPGLTSEPVNSINGVVLTKDGLATSNTWGMTCNDPQALTLHLNWVTNGVPSNPSVADLYGNEQLRVVPVVDITGGVQLHSLHDAPSGQYCFEEEAIYADNSHNVSALVCTQVDLTNQTAGVVFGALSPQGATYNLWLVSNTTGSSIAIGKFPAPATGGPTGIYWDGPTTIAAGGNGATAPPATDNTTGMVIARGGGFLGAATAPSGACSVAFGGVIVLSQDGHATYCPTGGGTWTTKF